MIEKSFHDRRRFAYTQVVFMVRIIWMVERRFKERYQTLYQFAPQDKVEIVQLKFR